MNKFFAFCITLILVSCSYEEVTTKDTFVKFYEDEGNFMDMTFTSDSTRIVLLSDSYPSIIVVDLSGNVLKRKVFPGYGGLDPNNPNWSPWTANKIRTLRNGYLVVGTLYIDGSREGAVWLRLNESFNVIDSGVIESPNGNYRGVDIAEFSDGGIFVAGNTDVNGSDDFFYSKVGGVDPWARIQTRVNSADQLVTIVPLSDDSFLLVGSTETPSDDGDLGLNVERTVISKEGLISNSQVYGSDDPDPFLRNTDDEPTAAIAGSGVITICGYNSLGAFLMFGDLHGAISITKKIEGWIFATSLTRTRINDYFLVGVRSTEEGVLRGELAVWRVDQTGTVLMHRTFGLLNGNVTGMKVLNAPDGSFFVAARYDFGNGNELGLLKMNEDGELLK